jgi:hypothetical protein
MYWSDQMMHHVLMLARTVAWVINPRDVQIKDSFVDNHLLLQNLKKKPQSGGLTLML